MSAKTNIELGFVGRNEINDAIDPDEYKEITKGTLAYRNVYILLY